LKVLIIGGYGFVGSHTAERFYKEGNDISIIDNMSCENCRIPDIKHKHYKLDARSWSCGSFIKNGNFDVAIFLCGKDVLNGDTEAFNYNVNILSNMLELCSRYNVKKFIFVSSTDIYSSKKGVITEDSAINPSDIQGVNFSIMEEYCNKWHKNSNMQIVILRTCLAYGEEQDLSKGIISEMLFASKGETIKFHKEKLYNFIYIGDLVDAIFRSTGDATEGTYNILPDEIVTTSELATYIPSSVFVEYSSDKYSTANELEYDNSKAKTQLEWVPIYSFAQGYEKTLAWYNEKTRIKTEKKKSLIWRKFLSKTDTIPTLENLVLFIICALITFLGTIGVGSISVDFRILYIIVVGVFFGTRQSMLAAGLSCLLLIAERMLVGVPLKSVMYDLNIMLLNVNYLIIGVSVGYMVERKNATIDIKDNEIVHLKEDYNYLYMLYDENRKINAEFEERLLQYGDSYGRLFSIVSELDTLLPDKVLFSTFDVLEQILNVNKISIYLTNLQGTYLRRAAATADSGNFLPRSARIDDYPQWKNIIINKEIYKNDSFNPSMPAMAAPIVYDNRVIALVLIEEMEFEKLSLYYYNLFKVVISLVSSSITKAYLYEEAIVENSYFPGTLIMREPEFKKLFSIRYEAMQNKLTVFTILQVEDCNDYETIKSMAKLASSKIRENDYLGIWEDGRLYILLSNTDQEDAKNVINRLEKVEVFCKIAKIYLFV